MDQQDTQQRTFQWELRRALCSGGIIEAFSTTYVLYFLESHFHASDTLKSSVLSAQRGGLLLGFLAVALAQRAHHAPSRMAAWIFFVASIFLAIGASASTAMVFALGFGMAFCLWSCTPPLVTQVLRANYPSARRGRLFSSIAIVRGLAAVAVAQLIGQWLEIKAGHAELALWLMPLAFVISGAFLWQVPTHRQLDSMSRVPRRSYWAAFSWLKRDRRFALAIVCWMFVGMGMLMSGSLLVEYINNPDYGLDYSPGTIALISVAIPTTVQLTTTYFWGGLFDRIRFFRLRLVLNTVGSIAILVLYLSPSLWGICLGAALLGLFRGGGNIMWNLWVTKLAPEDHVGEYMSVHTFFTGIRGILTPWLGFYLLSSHGPAAFAWTGFAFVTLSSITVIPLLRGERPPQH